MKYADATYNTRYFNFRIFNSDPLKQREQRHEDRPPGVGAEEDLDFGRGGSPTQAGDEGDGSPSDPPPAPSVICAEMLFRCNYVAYVAELNRDGCLLQATHLVYLRTPHA